MNIRHTSDYDQFKVIVSNREVDKRHVKKLAQSIKHRNLMFIKPILVNSRLEIIDGQHRLEACRIIGEPVHYMVVDGLDKDDIAILNTAQKNWTMLDFINFFTIEGLPAYREISKLINEFPEQRITSLMNIACGRYTNTVRSGNLRIGNIERARQLCAWSRKLRNQGYEFVTERNFMLTLNRVIATQVEFESLISRIMPDTFFKCHSEAEYKKMIKNNL